MQTQTATFRPAKADLLGVCAALGEDFGFNPEYLRVPLVIAMLFAAQTVVIGYLALAAVVWASRIAYPAGRRRWTLRRTKVAPVAAEPAVAVEPEPMRLAA